MGVTLALTAVTSGYTRFLKTLDTKPKKKFQNLFCVFPRTFPNRGVIECNRAIECNRESSPKHTTDLCGEGAEMEERSGGLDESAVVAIARA